MATELAKAYVQIVPSAEGISGEISNAIVPEASSAGDEAGQAAGDNLVSTLKKVVIAAGIGAAISKAIGGVGDFAEYGDNIDKMSQKMGLSREAYQEWDAVMQHSGTSMEAMKASMKTLANAAQTNSKAFEDLGISQEQLASMSQQELFEATIGALQNVEDETQRTYLAGKTLGRGATELGALLNTSAEDTQAMRDRVHELGGVMSDDAVKAAAAYQDSLQDMQTAMASLGRGIAANLLPGFTQVMNGITELFSGNGAGGVAMIADAFGSIGDAIAQTLPGIMQTVGEIGMAIINGLRERFPAMAQAAVELIGQLASGITSGAATVWTIGSQIVSDLLASIRENAPRMIVEGGQAINDFVNGMLGGTGEVADGGNQLMQELLETLAAILPSLLETGLDVVSNLVEGILQALPDVITAASETLATYIDTASGTLPELIGIGMEAVFNLVNGIVQNLPAIASAALQAFSTLLTSILNNAPQLLTAGIQLITRLVQGLLNSLPQIVASAVKIVAQLAQTIAQNLPQILQVGGQLIGQLLVGIVNAVPQILGTIPGILSQIGSSFLGYNWGSIGSNIISGIAGGLSGGVGAIVSAAKQAAQSALDAAKNLLGIKSPSRVFRDEVGKMMALGMAEGFEDNLPTIGINHAVTAMTDSASQTASRTPVVGGGTQTFNIYMQVDGAQDPTAWASQFAADLQRYARMA